MNNDGITAITFTDNQTGKSATVSPEAFHRFVKEARTVASAVTAQVERESVPVRTPAEIEFQGEDFMADAALEALLSDVIASYDALRHITRHDISVTARWKRKGGKKQGAPTFAKCVKTSGLTKHFGEYDFVIWLGADNIAEQEWSTEQIWKLLYHECRHIGWDEGDPDDENAEGKAIVLGHDLEIFTGEVQDTGAWEHFRQTVGREFTQPGLFS